MSLWTKAILFISLSTSIIGCTNQRTNHQIENIIFEMLLSDDTNIDNFPIINLSGDTIPIKSLVNNRSIVIIGLYNVDCPSCADRELELLKSIIRDENNEDIIILGNFSSIRKMKVFQDNIPLKIYSDKNSVLQDYIDYDVFIFRLSTDLKAYSIIDLMAYPSFSKLYYEAAIENKRLNGE